MKTCYDHITSETIDGQPYYTTEVYKVEIERAKAEYESVLKEGLEKGIISNTQNWMQCVWKTKAQGDSTKHNQAPPVGPITSGSGSLTEGIATYVEHFFDPFLYVSSKSHKK